MDFPVFQGITLKLNDKQSCMVARIFHGGMIHRQGNKPAFPCDMGVCVLSSTRNMSGTWDSSLSMAGMLMHWRL